MCLYVDSIRTAAERADPSTRTFYKVFYKDGKAVRTPYMRHVMPGPGVYTAPEAIKPFTDMIGQGAFHARTELGALKEDLFWIEQFELGVPIIFKIIVKAEDIVAYGNKTNAAFKSYEITKEDWDKPVKWSISEK